MILHSFKETKHGFLFLEYFLTFENTKEYKMKKKVIDSFKDYLATTMPVLIVGVFSVE
jgi:hypothetical protein